MFIRTQSTNINIITRSNIEGMVTRDFNPKWTDFPLNSHSNLKKDKLMIPSNSSALIEKFT